MNLIVLYGPPGSGKFTLAKKLSKYYSYTLLHNHAIFELINSALNKQTDSYWDFCWKIREDIVVEGLKENLSGMVMTRAGTGRENEQRFFSKMKTLMETSGGSIVIVKLSCSMKTLNCRVKEESRKQFTKVQTEESLDNWFRRYQDKTIMNDELIIDNNTNDIEKTISQIITLLDKKGIRSE